MLWRSEPVKQFGGQLLMLWYLNMTCFMQWGPAKVWLLRCSLGVLSSAHWCSHVRCGGILKFRVSIQAVRCAFCMRCIAVNL